MKHKVVKIPVKKQPSNNAGKAEDKTNTIEAKTLPKVKHHKCSHCSFSTIGPSKLLRHIEAVHSDGKEGNFKCTRCEYSSKMATHLARHVKYVHPELSGGTSNDNGVEVKEFKW